MLYRDFKAQGLDCEDCPLHNGFCKGATSDHNGNMVEPPCCYMDDDTEMDTFEDVCKERDRRIDDMLHAQWKEKEAKEIRKKIAAERRSASRWHVRDENTALKRLRKQIGAIQSAFGLADAFSFASSMIDGEKDEKRQAREALKEKEIAELRAKIAEVEAIKNKKLKELRKQRAV